MVPLVLVVDDSPLARATLSRRLRERGLSVAALGSAAEAAEADLGRLSAALLDIELADGVGPDLGVWLRGVAPELPIAFLTAGGPARLLDAARRLGPVFWKTGGVDEAVAWAVDAAAPARVVG